MSEGLIVPQNLAPLPLPLGECDKDARGRVLVVGGGRQVPGAILLAAEAALRAGAGKLQIATPEGCSAALAVAMPEARVIALPETREGEISSGAARVLEDYAKRADAVVIGPGMLDETTASALAADVASLAALVIDAGALTDLPAHAARLKAGSGRMILTPHAGEMASLLGVEKSEVVDAPVEFARQAAARFKAVIVMKGQTTYVVTPDGEAWRHEDGVIGLATSGSGDVLAGIIGGLLARGAAPLLAAQWGVWLHGAAGRQLTKKVGPLGFLAREIAGEVPALMGFVRRSKGQTRASKRLRASR